MSADKDVAVVSPKGARRWQQGHPWIFRSDVAGRPESPAGAVQVRDTRGKPLGVALWSPKSEISLRLLDRDPDARIDAAWWLRRIAACVERRAPLRDVANAYRLVHGEGDGIPSLICDRYADWIVVQITSAGLEAFLEDIVAAIHAATRTRGILARNDVPLRKKEGLTLQSRLLAGEVPETVEVNEHGIRYLAAPWEGQKTGAFLDQRENRVLIGQRARVGGGGARSTASATTARSRCTWRETPATCSRSTRPARRWNAHGKTRHATVSRTSRPSRRTSSTF